MNHQLTDMRCCCNHGPNVPSCRMCQRCGWVRHEWRNAPCGVERLSNYLRETWSSVAGGNPIFYRTKNGETGRVYSVKIYKHKIGDN